MLPHLRPKEEQIAEKQAFLDEAKRLEVVCTQRPEFFHGESSSPAYWQRVQEQYENDIQKLQEAS